jgi:hypothetical protein
MDQADAHYHMIHAVLLIASGSSFPLVAAQLCMHGAVLEPTPKEGVRGIYETSEDGLLDQQGQLLSSSPSELASMVRSGYQRREEYNSGVPAHIE